jgi:hypothetical protein
MPTSFLEIVELPDGRIELRRAEDEGSLVTLDFSDDAKAFLHTRAQVIDQLQHVGRGRFVVDDDVVVVPIGDFRPTDTRAFQARLFDQVAIGTKVTITPLSYNKLAGASFARK